ncbi:MAG: hypothetical protein WCI11_18920 [Candidatus Methylumidiphilus sp.]
MGYQPQTPDPLEQVMTIVIEGFKRTTESIHALRNQQAELELKLKQQAKAAYHGMTGSGKSRYVAQLVEIEKENEPRGAQARAAETLELSPGRITQLLKSDKNRANGK